VPVGRPGPPGPPGPPVPVGKGMPPVPVGPGPPGPSVGQTPDGKMPEGMSSGKVSRIPKDIGHRIGVLTASLRSGRSQCDGDEEGLGEVCDLHFELRSGFGRKCCYELDSEI
jgi:hypothetical protein